MTINEQTIHLPTRDGWPDIQLHTVNSTPSSPAASSKPALLFFHFWGGSNRTFSRLISQLSNDFAMIAPSLRGWGRSSKPIDPGAYHIRDYVDDIMGLILVMQASTPELLRNGIVLVGHSMGGKIAQILLTRPEAASLVKGMILLAPAPVGAFRLPGEMREMQVKAYESRQSADMAMRSVLLGNAESIKEAEIAALVADAVAGSPGAKSSWPSYGMAEDFEEGVREAIWGLKQGQLQVLVVVSELDQVEPEAAVREKIIRVFGEERAMVRAHSLKGVGHMIPIEAPVELAAVVKDFLGCEPPRLF